VNYFKTNLKYIRKRFDITQSELALQLKTGQSTIASWENGHNDPDVENLINIHQTLAISIDTLLTVDMKNGNLITDADVKHFKQNGNLSWNLSGNLKAKKIQFEPLVTMANEPDETTAYMLANLLKNIHADIGKISKSVNEIHDKVVK
jgi:transcriptional regulator with XRE-family HTH domain